MTSFCLIRHGRTAWNASGRIQGQEDVSLNPLGVDQVLDLLTDFRTRKAFDEIYSSPLHRAIETASIIVPIDKSILTDYRLKERHFGFWQGMLEPEVKEKYSDIWNTNWRLYGPPNGESQSQLVIRAASFLDEILPKHEGQRIAIVSHECLLAAMLGYILKMPLEMHQSLRWDNCGYIWVSFVNGHPRLEFK